MPSRPTYKELERKIEELEKVAAERKLIEESLVREKDYSNSIIDSLPGIYYFLNEAGEFKRWNKNLETVSGYSAEEISEMRPRDFFEGQDKELVKRKIEEVFTERHASVEADLVSKDGTRTPFYFTGLRIQIGSEYFLAGVGINISNIKQAEKILQESEQSYYSLFENHHAVMLLIDPETSAIIDANPAACAYYGYSRPDLKKMKISDINILPPEDLYEVSQLFKEGKRNYFNFIHRLAGGIRRDVEVYSGPVTLQRKTVLFSVIHDVTERKQVTAERERLIVALQDALSEVKTLRGFIPICANCKKIRDDAGYWNQIETYIQTHSEAQFSHSICPECADILYPELAEPKKKAGKTSD